MPPRNHAGPSAVAANDECCIFDPMPLTQRERELVLNQIKLVLEDHYVHLHQKEHLYGVQIVQRLDQLLEDVRARNAAVSEAQFSRRLIALLSSMRDRHVDYVMPYAQGDCVAYLPFVLSEIREDGRHKYIVSAVEANCAPDDRVEHGAEIVSWNGMPIVEVLQRRADEQPGCSGEARRALAVRSLPMRVLPYDGPPEEAEVTVDFVTSHGTSGQRKLRWKLIREPDLTFAESMDQVRGAQKHVRYPDIDMRLALMNFVRRDRYTTAPAALEALPDANSNRWQFETIRDIGLIDGKEWLRVRYYRDAPRPFAYIRILRFPNGAVRCQDLNELAGLFCRFQSQMPTDGLVLDIRNNPGGAIQFADCLLQMLTDKKVEPPRMQLRNTERNLAYCSAAAPDHKFQLARWVPLIKEGMAERQLYSAALDMPVFDDCKLAPRRRAYFRSVVLITNALSYSAADMFAAGFQDHGIGPILGVHGTTGAGGANKMHHDSLSIVAKGFQDLPQQVAFTFPLLRTLRRGHNEGRILEDYGVQIDEGYIQELTRNDVMHQEIDLIRRAAALIGL